MLETGWNPLVKLAFELQDFLHFKIVKILSWHFSPIDRSRDKRCVSNTYVLLHALDNPTFFYRKKIKGQNFQKSKMQKFYSLKTLSFAGAGAIL
ncbi:hypothetical protein EBT25_00470 [bacterium]|nr:hypothetical protein [bacterium]